MESVILGRKATEQELELINKINEMLLPFELELYAIGAPNPKPKK